MDRKTADVDTSTTTGASNFADIEGRETVAAACATRAHAPVDRPSPSTTPDVGAVTADSTACPGEPSAAAGARSAAATVPKETAAATTEAAGDVTAVAAGAAAATVHGGTGGSAAGATNRLVSAEGHVGQ